AELLLNLMAFDQKAAGAVLVITGEGRLDGQSLYGKTTVAVAHRSRGLNVPVLALAGGLGPGYAACYGEGISGIMTITPGPMTLEEAQAGAAELIADATARAMRLMAIGKLT
ncbi:MAG: glycerate kinase, partial [Chloroflexota bacterium]|nr:glycerate kinase [Chloroflexota bacterium]